MIEDEMVLLGGREATRLVERDIQLASDRDVPVLISGEAGVGKHVVARLIHERSRRAAAPLVTIDGDAFPRGIERASNGTLILDRPWAMSPAAQAALMGFLETGEIPDRPPVDGSISLDIRTIAVTCRDLLRESIAEPLYYRLNVIHIPVRPLRDRIEDLPPLLSRFLADAASARRVPVPAVSSQALNAMMQYHWPGNVRELKELVEALVPRTGRQRIEVEALPLEQWHPGA